jgi:hypothetical protein
LDDAAKFGLQEDGALHLVVSEETLDGRPNSEGVGVGLVDEVEDRLVDGCVEPIDEATVDLAPFGVAVVDERWCADMTGEAEFAQNGIKETPPLTVIGVREIKNERNVITDVNRLNHGKRSRLRSVEIVRQIRLRGG